MISATPRASRPHLPALIVTGYADLALARSLGEAFVLQKPSPKPKSEDRKRAA